MELKLERDILMRDRTLGQLSIEGKHFCWTLEDTVRPAGRKIYGDTAIPAGTYEVKITRSARFKKDMLQIMNVPGFEGVRIHGGNRPQDTEGCVLVGFERDTDYGIIRQSASTELLRIVKKSGTPCHIIIIDKEIK